MYCVWCLVLVFLLQSVDITTIDWPKGTYALLKPTTGCPTGWQDKGWIFQDTEDTNPSNNKSKILNIDGYVHPSYVIRSFCVKTTAGRGYNWPKGKYCIYRKRNERSLAEMSAGWIKMEDEKSSNKDTLIFVNSKNWILYWSDRQFLILYYRCMTNGNKKIPIELPITKPFYLLPYGSSECQQVKWMVATTEWIKYDLNNPSQNSFYGTRPFLNATRDSKGNEDITMFYCYYQSCKYTLVEKKGVFQSPGFPHKYPDGQLCSWRIMVPSNHTIQVHFTNFSLEENEIKDNLTFFKHANGSFQMNTTYHGHRQPFTLTATNDVLFELLTNEEHNSTGFRAEYTIFETYETTPAPSAISGNPSYISTTRTEDEDVNTIPTTTETKAKNGSSNAIEKSRVSECDKTGTIIAIVILLVCLIVIAVVGMVIFCQWRSKVRKCEKCEVRFNNEDAVNKTYDRGHIPVSQHTRTSLGANSNDVQMYQTLSRDQPQYEAPDYSKQNGSADPKMFIENPEYHELEPIDNNVPEVVYNVLEGPDAINGPFDEQTYQALSREQPQYEPPDYSKRNCSADPNMDLENPKYLELEPMDNNVPEVVYNVLEGQDPNNGPFDERTYQELEKRTKNPLYQPANPATMETQNPLYGSIA